MQPKTISAADVETRLLKGHGLHVRVILTDNSSTLISFNRAARPVSLRLHHMFRFAGLRELDALARFIKRGRRDPVLREFLEGNGHLIRRPPERPARLRQKGEHHDLGAIFRELNEEFFQRGVQAKITWGREARPKKRLRHIRLGSFDWDSNVIRVHPRLDRDFVPAYVVRAVVFHEMCHAHLPREEKNGKRVLHGPAFREFLERFPDTDRAERWQKNNLARLLKPKRGAR